MTEDVPLVITALEGLLANDNDPDGDPLSVLPVPVIRRHHGAVTLNPDGSFTYTPEPELQRPGRASNT